MQLHQALNQLQEIQARFTRVRQFRLLRAVTVMGTSLLGLVAAALQTVFLTSVEPMQYVWYWSAVAGLAIVLTVSSVGWRYWCKPTRWDRELWIEAAIAFMPALFVGAVLTLALLLTNSVAVAMLPGLWMLLFGLGVWSAAKVFPGRMYWVAGYYFVFGTVCLIMSLNQPFSPWMMGFGFGGGQLLMSGVLDNAEPTEPC